MDPSTCSRPLTCAQEWVRSVVKEGDTVIDATAGNGHDTLFLAQLVGPSGHVHAFDIQHQAIEATALRLEGARMLDRCALHQESHARMAEKVSGPVKAIMFNLGYLPGGDKAIITDTSETLVAIETALNMLSVGGVVSVVCYPGHDGGNRETQAVYNYLAKLSAHMWRVAEVSHFNAPGPAPSLLAAFKLRD